MSDRDKRLARIRYWVRGTLDRGKPANFSTLGLEVADDVLWLLDQIPEPQELEYRVELQSDCGPEWVSCTAYNFTRREAAEHWLASVPEYDRGTYRIVSAPVQVWTAVEDSP